MHCDLYSDGATFLFALRGLSEFDKYFAFHGRIVAFDRHVRDRFDTGSVLRVSTYTRVRETNNQFWTIVA